MQNWKSPEQIVERPQKRVGHGLAKDMIAIAH